MKNDHGPSKKRRGREEDARAAEPARNQGMTTAHQRKGGVKREDLGCRTRTKMKSGPKKGEAEKRHLFSAGFDNPNPLFSCSPFFDGPRSFIIFSTRCFENPFSFY